MNHRQRFIDDTEPFRVVKDIEEEKKTRPEKLESWKKTEEELKKVLHAFDTKKKIQIPKSLINIQNNNLKNNNNNYDKNEKKINNTKTQAQFELQEFKRPESYIIYSSKEREEKKPRDYEAKSSDYFFLEYNGDFMKIEILEKIISALENAIGNGEKIPDEMAKKIIEEKFSKYKSKSETIIKYFNDRRTELKKSLVRKYWRLQKSTDKYFTSTFRRREREKMKIRKNNQKIDESLKKIEMASQLCSDHLISIIKSMKDKEEINQQLMKLENISFLSKISIIQNKGIPQDCIDKNKTIIAFLNEKGINYSEIQQPKKEEKNIVEGGGEEKAPVKVKIPRQEGQIGLDESNMSTTESKINLQDIICPQIDFSSIQNKKEKKKSKSSNKYRIRIRLNRNNKITLDRYIQKKNSMNPFDDSFNESIFALKKYNPSLTVDSINYNCFESLLKEYYTQKYQLLEYITDNDDDYDLFFKNKKSNKRLLSKKRGYNNK